MKRWWIVPALIGVLAIAGFAYWGYGQSTDKKQLLTYLNNRNQMAFFQLTDHVENVEAMLSKSIVSNSPKQRMMLLADIWQQAYSAQSNLTQIPISGPSVTRTSSFLTQTGDFAWSLAKKYARGTEPKPEDLKKLNQLHTQAGFLAVELQKIQRSAAIGRLSFGELKADSDKKLKKQAMVPSGLGKIDKNMQGFPTLIYDGPFSDHIYNRTPRGLTGANINQSQAQDIARRFAESGGKTKYKVDRTDNVKGTIPAFRITLIPTNSKVPVVVVDVSKKGGHILSMLNTRKVNLPKISNQNAVRTAADFLAKQKFAGMVPTYMIEQHNTGIVIFEYKQDGVLIYPDLMKVKVALDNGEIVGFEGTSFVMNHHDRKLAKPKISEKEALAAVNPQLKIESKRLAVIPLETLQEVMVYEFRGNLNGDTFNVYINAMTGDEERILKVVDTRSGPVTL